MPDVLLFGATGYTGRLTARALQERSASFVVCGRNRDKLEKLAADTGAQDVRVAEAGDVDGLVEALSDVKVMITCVGPFLKFGDTALEAALAARVHYVDSTGEGRFIDKVIERAAEATAAGIAMAPALGFDEVPADTATTIASEGMERPDVVLSYAFPSNGSAGTLKTMVGIVASDAQWIENGRPISVAPGSRSRWAPMPRPLGPRQAIAFPFAEGHLAPLHVEFESLQLYATLGRAVAPGAKVGFPVARALLRRPEAGKVIDKLMARLPEGPTDEQRAKGYFTILAEARSGDHWRNVTVQGADVYGLSARFLAAGAMRMAADDFDRTGVLAPVEVCGVDAWRVELQAGGCQIEVYEPVDREGS
ncbi:MAG: saccharopine dehydrogenase NADP-binding domain-containing protein [Actinomycetota bacterium]|nr:saccharopine dehydrogenase NADP-binding domain-containing protein [Actinomycetota bacterium]